MKDRPTVSQQLMSAALKNDIAAMRSAIARGADVDVELPHAPGRPTLLCGAIPELSREAVRLLIESGANVNALDENGNSPLIQLAEHPMFRSDAVLVTEDLLRAGADVRIVNYRGFAAIDYAIGHVWSEWNLKKETPSSDRRDTLASSQRLVDQLARAGARTSRQDTKELLREIERMANSVGRA